MGQNLRAISSVAVNPSGQSIGDRAFHAFAMEQVARVRPPAIGIPNARPTVDIDMLRKGKADRARLVTLIKDCATVVGF